MKKRIFIRTLTQLKRLADDLKSGIEVSLILNGNLRSSKFIQYNKKSNKFFIFNYIDDTEDWLTETELKKYTLIYKAIKKGCLILE